MRMTVEGADHEGRAPEMGTGTQRRDDAESHGRHGNTCIDGWQRHSRNAERPARTLGEQGVEAEDRAANH